MPNKESDKRSLQPAIIEDLAAMVDYSAGSIVSRILMKNSAGSVTLFSFDAGQELSEHAAPFDALVQILEGKGDIIIDKKKHILQAGEIILMPANIPHAVKAPQRFKMLLVMLKGE